LALPSGELYVGAGVNHLFHDPALVHLDRGLRLRGTVEDPLQVGLREHVRRGPARGTGLSPVEEQQPLTGGVHPLVRHARFADRFRLVGETRRPQDPRDLMVEVTGPRSSVHHL
jgi:hypothetical protein